MSDLLADLAEEARDRALRGRRSLPLDNLRSRAAALPRPLPLAEALGSAPAATAGPRLRVIAELKAASPSSGRLRDPFEAERLAGELSAAGAAALSILTEERHFGGSLENLGLARRAAPRLPLLRKDFILDPWQVWEARAAGADGVLLITRLLPGTDLEALLATCAEAGLAALVETHDGEEIQRAVDAGATLVGVNARDLSDFSVDRRRAVALAGLVPDDLLAVAESGVRGVGDLQELADAGYDAALVGTALMRAVSPGRELQSWIEALTPGLA